MAHPYIIAVLAIVELTLASELLDIKKTLPQCMLVGPHLDLAHARVVDQDTPLIEQDKLTGGSRVPAFTSGFVDIIGPLKIFT